MVKAALPPTLMRALHNHIDMPTHSHSYYTMPNCVLPNAELQCAQYRNTLGSLIVTSKTMDTALDKNQPKLGILILAVTVEMLADGHGLLDKHVQVLRKLRGKALSLENTQNLITGHRAHLGDALRIAKVDTDLRRHETLLGQLADLRCHLIGRGLQP